MPKEVVQYPSTSGSDGSELSVHWDKGGDSVDSTAGYVQIAATRHVWIPDPHSNHARSLHADHSACAECDRPAERDDQPQARLAYAGSPGLDVPLEPSTVFTDPLGRGEINALIRVLRRARDQAFGADA